MGKNLKPLIVLAALLLIAAPAGASDPVPITKSDARFDSGGKSIQLEWFRPKRDGRYPAIVLLHDAAGMNALPAKVFRYTGNLLAEQGCVVLLVHYFDRTGHSQIDPADLKTIKKCFPVWRDTVRDAVKHVARDPGVDPDRIGLIGFSLGAFLSLTVATEQNLRIAAVVEMCGGLPEELWPNFKHLPPTLIIHGARDRVVPVKEAYALRSLLQECKLTCECRIFAEQDHLFAGDLPSVVWGRKLTRDLEETQRRTLEFFATHLKIRESVEKGK